MSDRCKTTDDEEESILAELRLVSDGDLEVDDDVREFDEADHPRDEEGKFTDAGGDEGGGGSAPVTITDKLKVEVAKSKAEAAKSAYATLSVTSSASGKGGKNKEKMAAGLAAIPEDHLGTLKNLRIYSVDHIISNGRQVAGAYMSSGISDEDAFEKIRVADEVNGHKLRDPSGTMVHEIGHALDRRNGDEPSRQMEQALIDDSHRMKSEEKYLAGHYLGNRHEMFAELYKLAYSPSKKGAYGMGQKRAEKVFAKSLEKLKALKL